MGEYFAAQAGMGEYLQASAGLGEGAEYGPPMSAQAGAGIFGLGEYFSGVGADDLAGGPQASRPMLLLLGIGTGLALGYVLWKR
jgi:hypothetical protein